MSRTDPDLLDVLRLGGVLPLYWRRKRETAPWHRGFRWTTLIVIAQCEKSARADGGRIATTPIEQEWPTPHCRACETATPGTKAAREGLDVNDGVSSQNPFHKAKRSNP